MGWGSPDNSGYKPAGIVHEGEWVAPKWMMQSPQTANHIAMLENIRQSRGYAAGGSVSAPSGGGAAQNQNAASQNNLAQESMMINKQLLAVLAGGIQAKLNYDNYNIENNRINTIKEDAVVG